MAISALSAATVMTASPTPITTCTASIAGSTVPSGTVPESASQTAVAAAPATTASQAPAPGDAEQHAAPARQQAPGREHQAADDEAADHAHVDDVRAERAHAAVGEHEALRRQDDGEHEAGEPRAEQDGGERCAEEVAARAAGDREVEHLGGEDERAGHAEQRHEPVVEPRAGPVQADADGAGREDRRPRRDLG